MADGSEARVLLVGGSPRGGQRLLGELDALDVAATVCSDLEHAATLHDARNFDAIAFARATLGAVADAQRVAFRAQSAEVRIVDVIAPLAVRQVLAALEHDPAVPRLVRDLDVERNGERGIARAEVLARCQLKLWMFRLVHGALASETLALVDAAPGIFTLAIAPNVMHDAYSVVLEANAEELLHFPFLDAPARA